MDERSWAELDDDYIGQLVGRVRARFTMKPKVAITGFGNSGKSSLFNAIYGIDVASVSMATDETTLENMTSRERFGIDFTDTPGYGTERFTLDDIAKLLDGQHVVVHVLNGASAVSADDKRLNAMVAPPKRITVVNKCDTLNTAKKKDEYASSVQKLLGLGPGQFLFVSAEQGTNVPELVRQIADKVPPAMMDAFIAQQRADDDLKAARIQKLIYAKATLAGVVGLMPIPIADIFILTPIQLAMVAAIGYFRGVDVSKERAAELIGVVGAGVGLLEAARQIVKLIPGPGSVMSAGIAFAGTVALGKAADAWFKSNMKMPANELRDVFARAAAQAKEEFNSHPREEVPADVKAQITDLQRKRESGQMTSDELTASIAKLEMRE